MSTVHLSLKAFSIYEDTPTGYADLSCVIPSSWKISSWEEPGTDEMSEYWITRLADLQIGDRTRTIQCQGHFTPDGGPKTDLLVCKVVTGGTGISKLRAEAQLYSGKLKELQGQDVPKFFGFYEGDNGYASVGVMILEYCGEPLTEPLHKCDINFRFSLLYAVTRLHIVGGIIHRDLDQRNIIESVDKQAKIIDFGSAEPHGVCPCADSKIPLSDRFSAGRSVACSELQSLCEDTELIPAIKYYGQGFDSDGIRDAEGLAAHYAPPGADASDALTLAKETWDRFNEWKEAWAKLNPGSVLDFSEQ
ncbi:hypothetical protein K466DRAFT_605235 [Polyporus arcularius HHB13444]|uniref:Protein kinase domain-containing protein n=1 Tax=Polyporus arcularius HHB13444 TaxID=1314778 RepID=A0A5C3NT67_9APHY|nr:hypothetical protein K466DRAFT_605235 [Polyporus arcularius HHB13444]